MWTPAAIGSVLGSATSLVVALTAMLRLWRHQKTPASHAHPPEPVGPPAAPRPPAAPPG